MAHPLPEELAPIVLPELGGLRVSFAMCVNRMCPHFGLHYGTEEGSDGSSDSRYEIGDRTQDGVPGKKLVCRYCGIERNLHAARSIRPIIRHFLSESLPFADCRREDCENHGLNAYGCMPAESPGRGRRKERSPYRAKKEFYLHCNGRRRSTGKPCGASVKLGSPQPRGGRNSKTAEEKELALHLIRLGLSSTHANGFDITADSFQRSVSNFGARFRDYHAYRNAFLLKPRECGQEDSTAVVVTDVLKVSLKRYGIGVARTQILNVIVSVLKLEDTWFVLAAHPYYLPKEKCPALEDLEEDVEDNYLHRLIRRWAGATHTSGRGALAQVQAAEAEQTQDKEC